MTRYIEGYASVWALDLGGDLIEPGAYKRTLQHWSRRKTSKPIRLVDTHDYSLIKRVVGQMVDAREDKIGLWTRWELLENDPDADAAWNRVVGGAITGMSIGYVAVRKRAPTRAEAERGVRRVLQEIALDEVSLVQQPMNEGALITRVESEGKQRALLVERRAAARQDAALQRAREVLARRRSA